MVTIPVNSQNKPVEYLTRKFAINYNLPTLGKLVDPANKFPALSTVSALALSAVALLKLRIAENGKAQAAGAEWDAELAAAKTFADAALNAVSASHAGAGFFPTPARIGAELTRYATRKGNAGNKWSAPGSYDANAFTAADNAPSASAISITQAKTVAIDIDLLASATDAEGDTITVQTVAGKNWHLGDTVTVNGIVLTMAANYHLTAAAPAKGIVIGPFVAVLYDGHATTNRNVTLTSTNAAPTGTAVTTTVANNAAVNKNLITLANIQDANTGDAATVKLVEFNGTAVPAGGADVVVSGKTFHVTQAGVVTVTPGPGLGVTPATFSGTFKVRDNDPGQPATSAAINWSIQNLS